MGTEKKIVYTNEILGKEINSSIVLLTWNKQVRKLAENKKTRLDANQSGDGTNQMQWRVREQNTFSKPPLQEKNGGFFVEFFVIPKPFVRRLGMDAAFLLSEFIVSSNKSKQGGDSLGDWFRWNCDEFFELTAWSKEQFDNAYFALRLNHLIEYDDGTFVKYRIERPEGHWFRLDFARVKRMER